MIKFGITTSFKAIGIVWRNEPRMFLIGIAFGKFAYGVIFWRNIND